MGADSRRCPPSYIRPAFTTKPGGALGLATAYAIVARHGGNLSVQTKLEDGTSFIVDLPASERSRTAGSLTGHTQTGTERLLVMDDEEALRKLMEDVDHSRLRSADCRGWS
jgi:hypothetical protein